MSSPDDLLIRPMSRAELDTAIDWAAAEGWNPGLRDAEQFWAADPDGFVAAEISGRMVGCGSVVAYGTDLGFMGLFIMDPAFRGRGLGERLWFHRRDLLRSRLDPGAPIGMDGVIAMTPFYARGGFAAVHDHIRMAGAGPGPQGEPDPAVRQLRDSDRSAVAALDARCFGADRAEFLKMWLSQPGGLAVGRFRDDGLEAFGVRRPCRVGHKIGPLFARSATAADAVLAALRSGLGADEEVFLDVPERNREAVELARRQGLAESFRCSRMYNGTPPELPWDEIFGVTTLELG